MRESWEVRSLVVVVALISSGCFAEYVLPGSGGDTSSSGDTMASGEAPTGASETGKGDTDSDCGAGQSRCGQECVDQQQDEAHCGRCDEVCKVDEMCLVGECRDVIVLDCTSCPCADQCPVEEDGVLEVTSGGNESGAESDSADSGGKDPQQRLCCELAAEMQVVCVVGEVGDALVCPG